MKLEKSDLISLVMGKDPGYDLLNEDLVKSGGYWTGGFVDKWTWQKSKLEILTEDQLVTLYEMLKHKGF